MYASSLAIGIDIGWSERQRSCAFAALDPLGKLRWPDRSDICRADITCCRFRLSELLEFLPSVREAMLAYQQTVVILDGPLGTASKPMKNRPVDSLFRCGAFRNRMQPADIDNETGRTYVDATYSVFEGLVESVLPWVGGDLNSPITVAETNPTVGLALLNPQFDPGSLPSRKRPLAPPADARHERAIRAKSDFYWRAGGNQHCAAILESPHIAVERNHENIAGLYCLSVAVSLAKGQVISCGDLKTGVYVFPHQVDSDWLPVLSEVVVKFGKAVKTVRMSEFNDLNLWTGVSVIEGTLNETHADQ